MKVSLRTVQVLAEGLRNLDGCIKGDKTFPYTLSGTVRRIIAKNLVMCIDELRDLEKAREGIIASLATADKPMEVPEEKQLQFHQELQKLLDEEEDLPLRMLKIEHLKLDGDKANEIPPTVLAALDPIIEQADIPNE